MLPEAWMQDPGMSCALLESISLCTSSAWSLSPPDGRQGLMETESPSFLHTLQQRVKVAGVQNDNGSDYSIPFKQAWTHRIVAWVFRHLSGLKLEV